MPATRLTNRLYIHDGDTDTLFASDLGWPVGHRPRTLQVIREGGVYTPYDFFGEVPGGIGYSERGSDPTETLIVIYEDQ